MDEVTPGLIQSLFTQFLSGENCFSEFPERKNKEDNCIIGFFQFVDVEADPGIGLSNHCPDQLKDHRVDDKKCADP